MQFESSRLEISLPLEAYRPTFESCFLAYIGINYFTPLVEIRIFVSIDSSESGHSRIYSKNSYAKIMFQLFFFIYRQSSVSLDISNIILIRKKITEQRNSKDCGQCIQCKRSCRGKKLSIMIPRVPSET